MAVEGRSARSGRVRGGGGGVEFAVSRLWGRGFKGF